MGKREVPREQKTQWGADDHEESAIADDSEWESDEDLDFPKQEVQNVEPRKSDLSRAEIDPEMKDEREIRKQLIIRRDLVREREETKRPLGAIEARGNQHEIFRWPERKVW